MSTEDEVLSLTARVEIIEQRLGIDPAAVVADEAAAAAAGAVAHAGNVQSDVEPPAVPDSPEDALKKADEADTPAEALDHVNRALGRWPEDEDLLAAQGELEALVAKDAETQQAEPS